MGRSGCLCRRACLRSRSGLGPRLPLTVHIQSRGHTALKNFPLSVQPKTWSGWMEKDKKACQFMCASRVPKEGREKQKKKRIARMSLTQLRTPCRALANRRSIVIPYTCCQQATLRRKRHSAAPPHLKWRRQLARSFSLP